MSIAKMRRLQIYPVLSEQQRQAALRFASAQSRRCDPNEVLYEIDDAAVPAYLLLSGSVEVTRRDGMGRQSMVTLHETGQITGEVAQLAGRPSLVEGRAGPEGCEVVPFDAAHLRALVIGSAEIGEIVMRAFILRRTAFITEGVAGSVLVGRGGPTHSWCGCEASCAATAIRTPCSTRRPTLTPPPSFCALACTMPTCRSC